VALLVLGILAQPWVGIVFLLLFMPFAFFVVARTLLKGARRKMKEASRSGA